MKTRAAVVLLTLSACPPPEASTTAAPETSTSTSADSTSTSTTGATDPTTSTTSTSTTEPMPDPPPPCPVGSLSCPCTQGGSCDPGLACEDGVCVEACAVGSLGCACTPGGGCDPGLKCDEAQTCVDDPMLSPPCMPQQDDCCGDGTIDDFEDCDFGIGGNGDGEACTLQCKHAVCGDGFLHDPLEACDGEEFCADDCTFKTCGDGVVQPHEWCEKLRPDDPECTDLCTDARKVVFVTSTHYKGGALGGLEGAHAKCQMHAEVAGIPGVFQAFLGTNAENAPKATLLLHDVPHVDVNGNFMGDDEQNFCGNGDFANIPDEFGNPHPGCAEEYADTTFIWAWAIWEFNSPSSPPTCDEWTNIDAAGGGALGSSCVIGGDGAPCDAEAPIYCIEV